MKCRIGLFGGSFDPVHNGHIQLALTAYKELKLHKIIFIPAKIPPHKKNKILTPVYHRLKMLQLALSPYPYFAIRRFELNNKDTTYTYQTLQYFKKLYSKSELFFILGTDSLLELQTWEKIDLLSSMCSFIAGKRDGVKYKNIPKIISYHLLKKPMLSISSSCIRDRLKNSKSIKKMVPVIVERYIKAHELYS